MKKEILALCIMALTALTSGAQKVLMTGDSHVHSKIYPETVGEIIHGVAPHAQFSHYGIVGAGFYTFNKDENMAQLLSYEPDILIVHLGTNDSYAKRFAPETIITTMQTFYDKVKATLPGVKMVFITPFDNKRKDEQGVYQMHDGPRLCAGKMAEFVAAHPDTYLIDNYKEHGMDFIDRQLIRADFVHLTPEGYAVLGVQVGEELIAIPGLFETPNNTPEQERMESGR